MITFTHSELCDIGEKYLRKTIGCKVTAKEIKSMINEEPDVIGFKSCHSFLLEAKTSKSDFLADKKKPFRINSQEGIGDFRYYICEKGLIKIEDLPPKWGLIYVNQKCKARLVCGNKQNVYSVSKWKMKKDINAEWYILFSLARRVCYKLGNKYY